MENLRDSIGIRRIDKGPNARIRELCGVTRGLMKSLLRCFSHVERMENDRIAWRVYVGVCVGSRSVGRPRKRGIYTVKDCLKKEIWISGKQGELRMVGECVVRCPGDEPLTRCHRCELQQLYEAQEGRKSVCAQAHNLRA